jgi:hypothetical protein
VCVLGVRLVAIRSRTVDHTKALRTPLGSSTAYLVESQPGSKMQTRNRRLVYPYSIVPGGVSSPEELRQAVSHDPVVASHYSGFNYRRARLIEVKQPQKVYLSYRLGNKVYWTAKQASLHTGEKLLTDGTLTARTRCGNQVSVLPKVVTSPQEPTMAELDRPDAIASGIERFPGTLDSGLLNLDPAMPFRSSGTAGLGGSGVPPGIFIPPPIGGGGGGSGGGGGHPGGGGGGPGGGGGGGHPPVTPEPGTIVLVLSGAGIIFARYRRSQ